MEKAWRASVLRPDKALLSRTGCREPCGAPAAALGRRQAAARRLRPGKRLAEPLPDFSPVAVLLRRAAYTCCLQTCVLCPSQYSISAACICHTGLLCSRCTDAATYNQRFPASCMNACLEHVMLLALDCAGVAVISEPPCRGGPCGRGSSQSDGSQAALCRDPP